MTFVTVNEAAGTTTTGLRSMPEAAPAARRSGRNARRGHSRPRSGGPGARAGLGRVRGGRLGSTAPPGADHWPGAFSALAPGAARRRGQVVGATTEKANAHLNGRHAPKTSSRPFTHVLGIDLLHEFVNEAGRPMPVLNQGGRSPNRSDSGAGLEDRALHNG